ncbi:MAG: DUF655 domain-containing protein [Methanobacteriaceae archaeon]
MEDYAIILDYLPLGYATDGMSSFKKKSVAQAIGKEDFTLLELIPKPGAGLEIHEEVYIGKGERDKIAKVKGRLDFENLTATSRIEIGYVIEEIVINHEEKYIKFFNEAGSLSTRLHQLELLPGIGNKHMWDIIKAREEEPFKSFEDLKSRVPLLSDPVPIVAKRIKLELDTSRPKKGKGKYNIFTPAPRKPRQDYGNRRNNRRDDGTRRR